MSTDGYTKYQINPLDEKLFEVQLENHLSFDAVNIHIVVSPHVLRPCLFRLYHARLRSPLQRGRNIS